MEVGLLETPLGRANANAQQVAIFCFRGVKNFYRGMIAALSPEQEWAQLISVTAVADADGSPTGRSDQIWDAFERAGIVTRPQANVGKRSGRVVTASGLSVAVWLSPGRRKAGAIEDMVIDTIGSDLCNRIAYFWRKNHTGSGAKGPSAKAKVAIWLALKANEGMGLGTAFMKGLIDLDHAVFRSLRQLVEAQLGHTRP